MANRLNVLQLRSSVGFFGAENVVLEIAKGLRQTPHQPFICDFVTHRQQRVELLERARHHGIANAAFACRSPLDFRTVAALREFIRIHEIAVVHSHGYKANFYALAATRGLPVCRFATCHPWTETTYNWRARFYTAVDKNLLRHFDHLVAVSEQVRAQVIASKVPGQCVSVIANGIDLSRFQRYGNREQLSHEFQLPVGRVVVGTIGRLVPEKGQHLMIEAAAKLRHAFPKAFFLFVGDGPLRGNLEQLIRQWDLSDRCRILGVSDRIPELLSLMHVFALPSLSEGLPMAVLEAMAARKPIIATNVGALPKVLAHERSALMIEPEAGSLAAALTRLMNNSDLMRHLAGNAYRRVQREFSAERMAQKYAGLYERYYQDLKTFQFRRRDAVHGLSA